MVGESHAGFALGSRGAAAPSQGRRDAPAMTPAPHLCDQPREKRITSRRDLDLVTHDRDRTHTPRSTRCEARRAVTTGNFRYWALGQRLRKYPGKCSALVPPRGAPPGWRKL